MDDQDNYRHLEDTLCQLIEVLHHMPRESRAWQKAMHQLLCWVPSLPNLFFRYHPRYPEILNETLDYIAQRIEEFQPSYDSILNSFANWVNYKLRHRYRVLELFQEPVSLPLDAEISDGETRTSFIDLVADPKPSTIWELDAEMERQQQQADNERIGKQLWNYIEQDPDNRLKNCASRKHPHCNCQEVVIRRYLSVPSQTLPQIAEALDVPYQTLVSQWKNNFQPLLQSIAREFGYSPNQDL